MFALSDAVLRLLADTGGQRTPHGSRCLWWGQRLLTQMPPGKGLGGVAALCVHNHVALSVVLAEQTSTVVNGVSTELELTAIRLMLELVGKA